MKNVNFINHENGSEDLKDQGLSGLRVGVKSRIGTRSLRSSLLPLLIGTLLFTLGVGQMWATNYLAGSFNSWSTTANPFNGSNQVSISLSAGTHTFKIIDNGNWKGNGGTISVPITGWTFTTNDNCTLSAPVAGTYVFTWNGSTLSVSFPNDKLTKQKYVYFDARSESNWKEADFNAKFYFKNYANDGTDIGNVKCAKSDALEDWVYYALVPNNANVGRVQMNRLSTSDAYWNISSVTYAYNRSSADQNCMIAPSSGWDDIALTWGTYCPIKKTSVISDNGTVTYGGDGGSSTPYKVEKGGTILVSASSTDYISDGNMTTKYAFYVGNSNNQDGTGTTYSYTASASAAQTHQLKVNSYNYYNSTSSTAKYSDILYYTTITCYTVTYDANGATDGDVPSVSGTKYESGTNVTLATNSGSLEKDGYSFNGWNTASGGGGTHYDAGGTLSGIGANTTLYAEWSSTPSLTVNAGTHVGTTTGSNAAVTLGNSYAITASNFDTGYEFDEWTASPAANASFASSTSASTSVTVSNGSVTVTANAKATTYTITYAGMDGATNFDGAPASYTVESSTIVLGTPTKTHYRFDGWTLGGSPVTQITAGSTGNKTLTATWTKLPMVYLRNTMNWANAYVSFYKSAYWDAYNGSGSSRSHEAYVADPAAMTYNSSTGLFEYECPDVYTYTYACFTKDKQDNYNNFYRTEAIYCDNNLQYEKMLNASAITTSTYNETKYYTSFTFDTKADGTGWFIPGGWSSWETKSTEFSWNSSPNVRFTKSLSANTDYEFKIYNHGSYYGLNSSATWSESGNKTLVSGEGNCTLKTTLAGTYTFDFNTSTKVLTISYPDVYAVSGSFNSWTQTTNLAFTGNDGTYSVTIDGSTTNYEFKILNHAIWYGHSDKTFTGTESNVSAAKNSNNIKLTADIYPSGSYTFAYNKSTNKLGVTYPSSYNVTFGQSASGGGATTATANSTSISSNKKIVSGATVVFTKGTTSTGYNFKGWYGNSSGTGDKLVAGTPNTYTISTLGAAATVYAIYEPQVYNITYKDNGNVAYSGNNLASLPATHTYNAATALVDGTKTGYTFGGWYTASDCSTGKTTSIAANSITSGPTYYAKWTANPYTITLNNHDATTAGTESVDVTFDATTGLTSDITVPEKTGYTFGGYYTEEDGEGTQLINADGEWQTGNAWINGSSQWVNAGDVTLHAKWTPNNYTVTLDKQTDAAGYGGNAGSVANQTVTFDAALTTVTGTMPTAANGYAFMGFYSAADGEGRCFIAPDGTWPANATDTISGSTWTFPDNITLHAYYKKAEITELEANAIVFDPLDAASGDVDKDYVILNPVIAPIPTGTTSICWEFLYDNGNDIPDHDVEAYTEGGTKPNQVRFSIVGLAAGLYKVKATLYKGSSGCPGAEEDKLDVFEQTITIANSFTVTIQYQDTLGNTIMPSTTSPGKATEWVTVSAPDIIGYTFRRWVVGDGVQADEYADLDVQNDFQYKATFNGTLTATYRKKNMLYFNNTLGWEDVYVYFYENGNYWSNALNEHGSKYGSGANKDWHVGEDYPYTNEFHGHMTQIPGTNVWYFDYTAESIPDKVNVAFTEADQHGYQHFYNTKVVRVFDFNNPTTLPMYVPLPEPTESYNKDATTEAVYYTKGYWMNYPDNTGYWLKIFDGTGGLVHDIPFEFTNSKTMPMSVKVELNANTTYGYKIYRNGASDNLLGNNGTMKINHSGDTGETPWEFETGKNNCGLLTSAAGDYTFTLTYGEKSSGNYYYLCGVHYPVTEGSYRLVYTDLAEWSQGTAHTAAWSHPSRVIYKGTGAVDTVSFFVAKGSTPKIQIQKIDEGDIDEYGVITWTNVGAPVSYDTVSAAGVYNFITKQTADAISVINVEPYTGNYYIRTDAVTGKWDNYRTGIDHRMTYSAFSESAANSFGEKFSHYKAKWCPRGTNIQFVIANDYSMCISDTLKQDVGNPFGNTDSEGTLNHEVDGSGNWKYDNDGNAYLDKYSANVRFMWHRNTNKISRAYVSAASDNAAKFLVLQGSGTTNSNIFDGTEGTEFTADPPGDDAVILSDNQNWMYETTVQANPSALVKVYANYCDQTQWFRGTSDVAFTKDVTAVELLGGTASSTKYTVRVIYDFKTNRLICAWMPSGASQVIDEDLLVNADVMIVRDHQGSAQCISFANDASMTGVKTVYGTMRFNRWILNNRSGEDDDNPEHGKTAEQLSAWHGPLDLAQQKSIYERSLYFVSFPFDVRVGEIFGFGHYWNEWYLQYYDGLNRAKNGYWIDSDPNWKYVTPEMVDTMVLRANQGYILGLDLDFMKADNFNFWSNGISTVELYFPSTVSLETMQQTTVTVPALSSEYECKINRGTTEGDRRVKDSYWRCIGVPSFNLYNSALKDEGGTDISWKTDYTWEADKNKFPFIYEWNKSDNTLTPQATSAFEFKPMHAYLVQIKNAITWTAVSAKPTSSIVARRGTEEAPAEYNWNLTLTRDSVMQDQTFVRMTDIEQVTDSFDFGQDMIKELNSGRSDIYTFLGYERLAANSMPVHTDQTTIIPVGLNIESNGEYTFSIPNGTDGVGVTLVDTQTGVRTSLSALDYTVTLSAGDYTDRFLLEISPVVSTPTDIDKVQGDNVQGTKARKVMIDGILYIIKDGKMYDARGVRCY